MIRKTILPAGTIVFHGTSAPELIEDPDSPDEGFWVSESEEVARFFADRHATEGDRQVIITYRLTRDVELCDIRSSAQLKELAVEHDLDLCSADSMRETVLLAGLPGWIIQNNYPTGSDILISDVRFLEAVSVNDVNLPADDPPQPSTG